MEFQRKRSSLGFLALEPGLQEIKITHARSSKEFYVIIRKYAKKLKEIEGVLKAMGQRDLEPIGDLQVGLACLALSKVDKKLYRAEILDISDKVLACFVDNGRAEFLSSRDLYFLPHTLIDIPSMAVRCCLSDKSPSGRLWTSENGPIFRKVYSNKPLVAKLISSKNDALWILELLDPRCTVNFDINAVCFPKSCSKLSLSPGTLLSGTVCWFTDYNNFHVQLSMLSESFGMMMSALQAQCNHRSDHNVIVDPQPGDMVAALFCCDEVWYRAKIERVSNTIEVYFVDYGNKEIVSKNSLLSLSHEFMQLPEQAILCSLADVNASKNDKMDPDFQGEVKIEFLKTLGDKYVVHLFYKDVSLSKKFEGTSRSEMGRSGTVLSNGESKINSGMLSANGTIPNKASHSSVVNYTPAAICYNSPCKVYITYVRFSSVWIQVEDNVSKASMLLHEMNYSYGGNDKSLKSNTTSLVQGKVYACMSTDGNWYRCQINKVCNDMVIVQLIDYGNEDTIPIKDIYILMEKFEAPLFCLECKIDSSHDLKDLSEEKLFNKLFCQMLDATIRLEGDHHIIRFENEILPIKMTEKVSDCNIPTSVNGVQPVISSSEGAVSDSSSPSNALSPVFTLPGLHLNIEYHMEELNVNSLKSLLIKITLSPPGYLPLGQTSKLSLSYPKEVRVGAYYYSLGKDDATAKRVQILSCSGDSYFCYYIDEGKTATLPISLIFEYVGDKTVPPLWWSCSLLGVEDVEENVHKLKMIFDGRHEHLTVVPLQYNGCGSYVVQLYQEGKCITEMLQSTSNPDIGILTARLGSVLRCLGTLVSDKTYEIKLVTDHSMMNHLVNILYEYYSSEREKLDKVEPGVICACYEPEYYTFCRGKVISVIEEEKAIVFLVDYGCNRPYKVSDLLVLPCFFASYRGMSNFAEIKSSHYLEANEVNLMVTGNEGKYLSLTPLPYLDLENCTQFFGYSQRIFDPGFKSQGTCSFSISPSSFWVQCMDDSLKLSELARDLSLSYSSSRVSLRLPCVLDVCVFYYLEEGMDVGSYFRGLVTELQSGSCRVQFVDYGNSASISNENIYVLKEEFSTIPLFATQCSLSGSELDTEWSEESLELFEKILDYGNKELSITFINQDLQYGSVVELYDGQDNLLSLLKR